MIQKLKEFYPGSNSFLFFLGFNGKPIKFYEFSNTTLCLINMLSGNLTSFVSTTDSLKSRRPKKVAWDKLQRCLIMTTHLMFFIHYLIMKTHLLYLDIHEWFRRTEEVEILSELIAFFSLKQTLFRIRQNLYTTLFKIYGFQSFLVPRVISLPGRRNKW